MLKIKIIHNTWNDYIYINFLNNILYRDSDNNERGKFLFKKNLLEISWDKWDKENFIANKNDNIFYLCEKINFYHNDWIDICYIDYINNIIFRDSEDIIGYFENNDNELNISWDNFDKNLFNYDNLSKENEKKNNLLENKLSNTIIELNEFKINKEIENKSNNQCDNENTLIKINNISENEKIHTLRHDILNINNSIKIPNIIHFVYGLKEQTEEFDLYKYIAIKSAHDINNPDKIYFYYYYEPYGYWWNKIKQFIIAEKINPPEEIYGNKIYHYAHQADIIRLQKLIERGGIYLDIDTICLKSFEDLLDNDFVMGSQTNSDNTKIYGLCNAVILCKPNSYFARKWLETYTTFRSKGRDEYWDEHGVLMPLELSKIYVNDILILNYNSFFYPLWYDIHNSIFNENIDVEEYKKIILNNYCIHLWDTYSNSYLKTLTENIIFTKNTIYNIISRKFLKNKISIVFLTYNRVDITKKCLESYLKCLDKEYIEEMIILDNNSDIELLNYLSEFQYKDKKIKIIFSDENLGVCHGRTILFNEAIGDIIISLDSDAFLINDIFFDKIINLLYDEKYGIIGISGAYIKSWEFGKQQDISDDDDNNYFVDHIAGCCQAFRKDLFDIGFKLDTFYGKFWVEDTDLSMQSLYLNKINYRISQKNMLEHHWGGSGKDFKDLFLTNWNYFANKWKGKVLTHLE
jgi:mannosyltransferase OCH1-like enzyme